MNIYGQTKGTDMAKQTGQIATMEAMGGMLYYALARVAQDPGLEEVAKELMGLGIREVNLKAIWMPSLPITSARFADARKAYSN